MNEENNIKEVYDQIHAPEALLGKVMEMKKDTFKFRNCVKFAVAAVAALALTFVAGNGICYAATGETLFSKIRFYVNGEEVEHDITWREEDGTMVGTFEMELDSVDEETGEQQKVQAQIEVQPDGIADEFAVEGDVRLEETVVLSVTVPEEGSSVTVETTDGEFSLSVDTDDAE